VNQSKQGQVSIPSTSQVKDTLKRSGISDNWVSRFLTFFFSSILAQLIVERLMPKKEVVQSESCKPCTDSSKGLAFSALFNAFSPEEKDVKNENRKRLMTTFLHTETTTNEPELEAHIPAASSPLVIHGYDRGNFQVVDFEHRIPTESYLDECRRISRMNGGTRPDFWHALYYYPTPISGLLHLLPEDEYLSLDKTIYRNNMDHLKHSMIMDASRAIRTDQSQRLYNEFGRGLEKRRLVQEFKIG